MSEPRDISINISTKWCTMTLMAHECEDTGDAIDKMIHDWPEIKEYIIHSSAQLKIVNPSFGIRTSEKVKKSE